MTWITVGAAKLIGNFTSNLAECWMSIGTKFDGGKQVNRCSHDSWLSRCYGTSLTSLLDPDFSSVLWNIVTGLSPSEPFLNNCLGVAKELETCKVF